MLGIGGVFFRANDPDALGQWYLKHLGIPLTPTGEEGDTVWEQEAGQTVFTPFEASTDYWPASKQWMLNFRVRDLDKMVAQLRSAGVEVTPNPDESFGRFARLHDPEGNAIELWEQQ